MSKIRIFTLGDQNEVGKNIYVFEAGLKHADDKLLGVDYIIPNYDYLKENKERIKGLFITHGHDEQMGAISDILVDLPDINIYGGKFTLEIIKQDLEESGIRNAHLIEIKANKKIDFKTESVYFQYKSHTLYQIVIYMY